MTRTPVGDGTTSACHERTVKTYRYPTPNSDTADHREAVVIGNLIFTPVKDEKPQMSPENRQSTAPETVAGDTGYAL